MPKSRQVRYHTELRRGDHISFYRVASPVFYYHHAVVLDVSPRELVIVSFTSPTLEVLINSLTLGWNSGTHDAAEKLAPVQRETITRTEFLNETVYVYEYEGRCYNGDSVISRALSVVNGDVPWDEYDLVTNNCEHFACWCKTGQKTSKQVELVGTVVAVAVGGILAGLAAYAYSKKDR